MRRHAPVLFVSALALSSLAIAPVACSSDPDSAPVAEAGADVPDYEEPVLDAYDPAGRVLILPIYHPDTRCFEDATEIGKLPAGPDGGVRDCLKQEVCYIRADGVLAYHDQDCIEPGDFRANWKRTDYSDLGPCEPIKHAFSQIKQCPNPSCTWARDAIIDTAASCATALETKGCRETFGAPTKCWCSGTKVFVAANEKTTAPPPSYAVCDGTAACTKALGMVDTVKGCEISTPADAGTDAPSDATASDAADAG